jgi:AcrR family transcriptional regulator
MEITTPQPEQNAARQARAEQIMDSASELLLRYGYKRLTIDDIAAQAGIGKGTIYLHWKTREALFGDVLLREYAQALDELVQTLHKDAQAALPERLISSFYQIVMKRPLLKAVYTADQETLGRLQYSSASQRIDEQENKVMSEYLDLLYQQGLAPESLTAEGFYYAIFAVLRGFFGFETSQAGDYRKETIRKAEILASTVQRLCAPKAPLTVETVIAIARRTRGLFSQYAEIYRGLLARAYQ